MVNEPKTLVVFRKWSNGDIIALFPCEDVGLGYCNSYEHIGQHSGADYTGVVKMTKLATQKEYIYLYKELQLIGYSLKVASRRPNSR